MVNQALSSLHERTIEITLTVPLIRLLVSRQRLKNTTSCISRLIIQNKGSLKITLTAL